MYIPSLILSVVAVVLSVSASPLHARFDYDVKESHKVPPQWSSIGDPHPLHLLTLNIGLEPGDFESLEEHLYQGEFIPPL
jgi:tripeptidyl-peptidase-1